MTSSQSSAVSRASRGLELDPVDALALTEFGDLAALWGAARARRDTVYGDVISYSPKVFIPLTKLCRDVCRYCTFAHPPRSGEAPYLSVDEAIRIAERGARAGCHEALFTLGDQPEKRYGVARDALARLGFESTLEYLGSVARAVERATGLLPHVNPGLMSLEHLLGLREVAVSAGLMLESVSNRLLARGGPHHGCPDKAPEKRIASIAAAGEARVPFTTGILVGIGETRRERIESILAIRELAQRYGHIQEVIVQNFRAKPGTGMARAPEASLEDYLWTIAVARLILPPEVSVQAPPNLSPGCLDQLLAAGVNDWGGVSPVTCDHVNPEAPWPEREALAAATERAGKTLVARLPIYPKYALAPQTWVAKALRGSLLKHHDASGFAREDSWIAGNAATPVPSGPFTDRGAPYGVGGSLSSIVHRARDGVELGEADIVTLFCARGDDQRLVYEAADSLRRDVVGDAVTYVVNRNINYTNVCYYRCEFCAFSKGRNRGQRGHPYDLSTEEIERRVGEAWQRGATEVCLQGGIHPSYSGEKYLSICRAVKRAAPEIHVHAFSPLEIWHGATTTGSSIAAFLKALKEAGLASLPGTAAEVLDDEVRKVICPDKVSTAQWLEVMEAAHEVGLPSTATIMFGHVDAPRHWARHLRRVRALQMQTGGFTEFVPLPFVHMEAPLARRGGTRSGPTFREAMLMHAVARLVLHPYITNIQASWVKMGPEGARSCLAVGANDLGGTLMNESITRAAGAGFGQELGSRSMARIIAAEGRIPRQRTTLYQPPGGPRLCAGRDALGLTPTEDTPLAGRDSGYSKSRAPGQLARFGPNP